ncbi:MAG: hypothetical protein HW405_15 [Candidatus Berkelbacteria bacterium]|nr:hypothetical protein [Candidatus Berkelbacteria bacterium]
MDAIKIFLANVRSYYMDYRLGITTRGMFIFEDQTSLYKDYHEYDASYYGILERTQKFISFKKNDVFIDLGCGKGRAVFFYSYKGIRKSIGIEINKKLIHDAKTNLKKFKYFKNNIKFSQIDAAKYNFFDETIIYLANPFGKLTLSRVLRNLKKSLIKNPRKIRIIYVFARFKDCFEKQDWLKEKKIKDKDFRIWINCKY